MARKRWPKDFSATFEVTEILGTDTSLPIVYYIFEACNNENLTEKLKDKSCYVLDKEEDNTCIELWQSNLRNKHLI